MKYPNKIWYQTNSYIHSSTHHLYLCVCAVTHVESDLGLLQLTLHLYAINNSVHSYIMLCDNSRIFILSEVLKLCTIWSASYSICGLADNSPWQPPYFSLLAWVGHFWKLQMLSEATSNHMGVPGIVSTDLAFLGLWLWLQSILNDLCTTYPVSPVI